MSRRELKVDQFVLFA